MAKDVFTAEELGLAPAAKTTFTAEELGLAAPKEKTVFTAEELFGVPSPKIQTAQTVEEPYFDPMTGAQITGIAPSTKLGPKDSVLTGTRLTPEQMAETPQIPGVKAEERKLYDIASPAEREALAKKDPTFATINDYYAKQDEVAQQKIADFQLAGVQPKVDPYAFDTRLEKRAESLRMQGLAADVADAEAARAIREGNISKVSPFSEIRAAPKAYDIEQEYRLRPEMTGIEETGQVLKRAGTKGVAGLAQGAGGVNRFIGDMLGLDTSNTTTLLNDINDYTQAIGQPASKPVAIIEGAVSSITQQLPALIGGVATGSEPLVLGSMFYNAFGQNYDEGKRKGLDNTDSAMRATANSLLEVVGEKFGLGNQLKALKGAVNGLPISDVSTYLAKALVKEIPGEQLTYAGQFAVDKGYGMNPEAGIKEFFQGAMDTMATTVVQGGIMMGAGAGTAKLAQQVSRPTPPEEVSYKDAMSTILKDKGFTFESKAQEKKVVDQVLEDAATTATDQPSRLKAFAQRIADFSNAEEDKLTGFIDNLKDKFKALTAPKEATTERDALDKQFADTVTKYQQQGFTADDANKLANEDFKELGYGDQLIARAGKPGISVSGEPSGTIPGTTRTGRTDLAGPSTTAGVAGSGETTELNTLAAELKAKYNLTDEQALKNAEESLRQKQMAAGMGAPTPPAITVPQNLIDLYAKSVAADQANSVSSTPANKRNATMASRRLIEAKAAQLGLTKEDYLKETETGETRALDAAIIEAYEKQQTTPAEVTSTEITPAKPKGRPKAVKTAEEIAAAQETRRQQAAMGRDAINAINRANNVLSKPFNAEADFATEKEAQEALDEFNNKRRVVLEAVYAISVDPNQKNKTAGLRAKEMLSKVTPQEAENAKLRHETRQKTKATAAPTLSKEDIGSFGRAITAQDLKDQKQLEATRRRLELQKPISIFTETFKKWFGKSKVVNKDGTPKKMYHGTARDIGEFQPKQANAIFLTEDPSFAEGFTYQSEDWMAMELENSLSKAKKTALLEEAGIISEEKGTDVLEEYRNLLKNQLESRKNIIPVYVKAEMPFDYENPDHIDFVIAALTPEEKQAALSNVSYDPNRLVTALQQGAWVHIESAPIQAAMRRVGFDGFYVREGGNKNLAVYNSNQIKSVFNENPTENANISRAEALIDEATNRNNNPKYNTFANATQAINWVAKNGNVFEKFLAKRIAPFLQGVKLVIVDDISQVPKRFQADFEGAAGLYYESKTNRTIYLDRASGINNTIFLHEALHGATMARINRFIKDFADNVAIPKHLEDAMLEMHRTMFAARDRLDALKELGIADDRVLALEKAGAFDDIKEFVAYGMSHPDMQEFLMQTKGVYAGEATESSLFNKFVQGIRKFFEMGAEHKSAMQDLIIVTNKLLNAPNEAIIEEDTAAAKKTNKKAQAIDKNLEKLQISNDANTAIEDIGKLVQEHGAEGYIDLLQARFDDMGSGFIKKILYNLQTIDIIRWVGDKIPALQKIDDLQNEMAAMRARLLASSAKKADKLAAFIRKNGSVVLSDTMHLARLERISPTQYADVTTALANDPVIKHYENLILDPNKTVEQKASYKGKITSRSKAITKMYAQWDKLGKQKGGHDMYIMVREFYKDNYTATRTLLDEQINAMNIDADAKTKLLKSVRLMQEQTLSGEDKELDGMKQNAIPEDYFPLKRDGKYWLRVAKGPTGREFYLFPSGAARNLFLTRRAKALGLDKNDGSVFSKGDDINALRKDFQDSSLMLQEIFANIETITANPKYDTSKYATPEEANIALKEELKDQIYQTYLMTMPERSFRKQFLHAEKITGFSADVLQNFKTSASSYANQLSKLKYGIQISNELQNARDSLTPEYRVPEKPLPTNERAKLELFINEIAIRAKEELNPPEEGQIVANVNRFAFLMLLTSGASAATQMTSVPLMVMPSLNAEYGYGASAKAFARYVNLFKAVNLPKLDEDNNVTWEAPSISSFGSVKGNKIRSAAFDSAVEKYNLFQLTNTAVITNRARTPTDVAKNPFNYSRQIFSAMTAMFSGAERMSREMTFMMIFDLEYAKTKNFDASVQKAVDTTHELLGRYDNFNRPRILRNALGRTVGQFKQYSVFMSSFFIRNGYNIIRWTQPIDKRIETMHRLSGVLVMGSLFGGLVSMPAYSLICSTIDVVLDSLGDEEEKRKRRANNPLTADDSNLRFRYEFLPKYFGQITVPGLDGRQHRLNELLEKGPISALTDINIGSRTSYDGLWFREAKPGKNYVETIQNYIIANMGPGVSTGFNMVGGIEDLNNGYISRGLEKLVPGLFKGPLVAERMRKEGAETKGGADILKKSEVNELNYIASVLGFTPTRLARIQEKNFQYQKQITEATNERTALLRHLDETIMDPENKQKGADIKNIFKKIDKFNKRYPAEEFVIEPDDIERSIEAYAKKRGQTIRGQYITEKLAPYLMKPTKAVTPLP